MVKKLAYNAVCVLSVLFMLWIALSWVDVVADNTHGVATHSVANFFVLIGEGATV